MGRIRKLVLGKTLHNILTAYENNLILYLGEHDMDNDV
jgi:hypothetical protein